MRTRLLLALGAIALTWLACDEVTPVAPTGSFLTITANPTQIDASGETSTVTVLARRENGTPVNPGTQVFFASTLGSIDEFAATDIDGVARATLTGANRIGLADVTASSGATESVATQVQIGAPAGSITLQPNPTTISQDLIEDAMFDLVATVRDETGQPLANAAVNFLTDLGTLGSRGGILFTDELGTVEDTLMVSQVDISALESPSFQVSAVVAGADGILLEANFLIQVQSAAPIAEFEVQVLSDFMVFFDDMSTGAQPLEFSWDFGDGTTATLSGSGDITHDYQAAGNFTATLTVTNDLGQSVKSLPVTVN